MQIDLKFDYLDRVRKIAALYTKRKTSDLLDGDFHSLQHGRSLDFDDLREYRFGDDVNMIDWKSSSRAGKTLIRRYFAERRHKRPIFSASRGSTMPCPAVTGRDRGSPLSCRVRDIWRNCSTATKRPWRAASRRRVSAKHSLRRPHPLCAIWS